MRRVSARAVATACALALGAAGCSPTQYVMGRALHARPAEHRVRVEAGVAMETSDGVRLVADVYRPAEAGRVPTILTRIPHTGTKDQRRGMNLLGRFLAARGYAVVIQATRGRGPSGGEHRPFHTERSDGLETLAWLSRQDWYDGRVGMWGGSYFGYTLWAIADSAGAERSAMVVQNASSVLHPVFHPGGAFALESALYWALRTRSRADTPPAPATLDAACAGWPLVESDDRTGTPVAFFDDWVTHVARDSFWLPIEHDAVRSRLRGPALLMGGWFDPFLPSLLADWSSIRDAGGPGAESRLRLGAWAHTYPIRMARGRMPTSFRIEALRPAVPWFDRHLEARGRRGELDTVVVRYWMMGRDEWREDVSWPPSRMRETAYYLSSGGRANSRRGDGRMSSQPPAAAGAEDRFLHDPSRPVPTRGGAMLGPRAGVFRQDSLEDRDDVLVYTTAPLERDLEIAGPVRLRLHVSTDAPSADFTAKLVDVHPDDSAWNVCDGILRRDFDPKPGGGACPPAEIEIELWPTAMAFLRGHRVRLEVASSNFPRFDRNPGTGRTLATETEKHPARQTVYHDAARPSRLILPVLSP